MSENDFNWETYYTRISGRQPRELLMDVLARFEKATPANPLQAIDLGCGDGTETVFLLANGWQVLAIDGEPAAFKYLADKLPPEGQERLQTQVSSFESVELSPADLIYAGYSVSFCHPQHFAALWSQIVSNIKPGGRFAGQLFGVNDTWATNPEMTFFTIDQARALFDGFEVEHFQEEDEDGRSSSGPKHWHIFHFIARKT